MFCTKLVAAVAVTSCQNGRFSGTETKLSLYVKICPHFNCGSTAWRFDPSKKLLLFHSYKLLAYKILTALKGFSVTS